MESITSVTLLTLLSVAWIVWIAFMFCLAIARAAKMKSREVPTAVGGALPFKSREEFLKAMMEMDLGEFLDRTYVTPKEITRWKHSEIITAQGPVLPPSNGRSFEGIEGSARFGQLGWGILGGAGGFQGVGGVGGAAGTMYQGSGAHQFADTVGDVINKFSGGMNQVPETQNPELTAPVKEGCWYRLKRTGELIRCKDSFITAGYFLRETGVVAAHTEPEVEIATPKVGETWMTKECAGHYCAKTYTYRADKDWPGTRPEHAALYRKFALCGCSVPFEFGHGKI